MTSVWIKGKYIIRTNWNTRFKNKTWFVMFLPAVFAFVYQVLGMLDILPPVTQDTATQIICFVVNVLVAVVIASGTLAKNISY